MGVSSSNESGRLHAGKCRCYEAGLALECIPRCIEKIIEKRRKISKKFRGTAPVSSADSA